MNKITPLLLLAIIAVALAAPTLKTDAEQKTEDHQVPEQQPAQEVKQVEGDGVQREKRGVFFRYGLPALPALPAVPALSALPGVPAIYRTSIWPTIAGYKVLADPEPFLEPAAGTYVYSRYYVY